MRLPRSTTRRLMIWVAVAAIMCWAGFPTSELLGILLYAGGVAVLVSLFATWTITFLVDLIARLTRRHDAANIAPSMSYDPDFPEL